VSPDRLRYGTWPSPISAARAAHACVRLAEPRADGETTTWIERRPNEGGRYIVVRSDAAGSVRDLTPHGFSARTRVHEYGGGSYTTFGGTAFFSNDADQRVYRQDDAAEPVPITPEPAIERGLRYADFDVAPGGERIACVREHHDEDGTVTNELVTFGTDGSSPSVIASGRDFYGAPRWAPDGTHLAFLSWDFPQMPWDGTELSVLDVTSDGTAGADRRVAGGASESVFQPSWSPDGRVHFVSDRTGWWNLYREDAAGEVVNLTPAEAEFGVPMWLFGYATHVFLSDGRIVVTYRRQGVHHMALLDPATGEMLDLDLPFTCFDSYLTAAGQRLAFIAGGASIPMQVVSLDFSTRAVEVLCESERIEFDPGYVAEPEPIEYATTGGRTAHAYYYPPTNPEAFGPEDERPPLVVNIHGGPTSEVWPELELEIQYFTSRGLAYVDVNYGGSTGYGRPFRESLYGRWGEVDVDDAIAAARSLVERGLADGDRLVITGGSAGGWTALCALAFRDAFAAGTSYFGVSDLEPFAKDTHKFESRYLDRLVGALPEAADVWAARSPARHADGIHRPLLILQGDEDEVVPPAQAKVIVEALERQGLPYAYLLFEGEQHGFRKAENIIRSLEAELTFYGLVLGFEPADDLPHLDVRNLAAIGRGASSGLFGGGGGPGPFDPAPRSRGRILSWRREP
jgi:dipeptidyl aminopeptidase/acylaminoacyl peptidase